MTIEFLLTYKYLGNVLDHCLCFMPHIESLVKKLNGKVGFFFRNKFLFQCEKETSPCVSVLDYGDIWYMNTFTQCLRSLDFRGTEIYCEL